MIDTESDRLLQQETVDGKAALGGAIGGALSFGIGEMAGHGTTSFSQFGSKTIMHGISGGIQSAVMGGDVGGGVFAGMSGHVFGEAGSAYGDVGGFLATSISAGVVSSATGGDFGQGFQIGGMQYLFNRMGGAVLGRVISPVEARQIGKRVGNAIQSIPSPVYDILGIGLGVGSIVATGGTAGLLAIAGVGIAGLGSTKTYLDYLDGKLTRNDAMVSGVFSGASIIPIMGPAYGVGGLIYNGVPRKHSKE